MDAAIRWSTKTNSEPKFLIADAAGSRLRLCEPSAISGKEIESKQIAQLDNLPEFTAFDWSRTDENLVALGTINGEARVVQLDAPSSATSCVHSFPIKQTRDCNSIAFSPNNLLASALKKHRTDSSLNVYDIGAPNTGPEPYRRLANGDAVANVKFFNDRPETLLAGIYTKGLRLYDIRDSNPAGASFMSTRQCHFLSIDSLDENYFAAAGPPGENTVCVWDRRAFGRSSVANLSTASSSSAVLELTDVIDARRSTTIRTLRFSGTVRGRFAILSGAGQLRQFDVAQNRPVTLSDAYNRDELDIDIGDSFHYLKKSHNIQHPWFHGYFGHEESETTAAFDWANPGSLASTTGIVQLRRDGVVEFLSVPVVPSIVKFTATNEIAFHLRSTNLTRYVRPKTTIGEELLRIQANLHQQSNEMEQEKHAAASTNGDSTNADYEDNEESDEHEDAPLSSQQRHEQMLDSSHTRTCPNIIDLLTILDTQRRRCEEGYLFDCDLNRSIVRNDPWLVDLWGFIKRLKAMAEEKGMICENLDLSYLGVNSIWTGNIGQTQQRVKYSHTLTTSEFDLAVRDILSRRHSTQYSGVTTEFPYRRQLSLIMCGWRFSEKKLRTKCIEYSEKSEHYKAIVVAFCHGNKSLAIDMLKSAIRMKAIDNSALAAVIACDTVSKEQRSLCEWMAEDASDPYLKAILIYFTTGDWISVTEMAELPLAHRIAIALQHLDDTRLDRFLKDATKTAIRTGDTEGILLTGLADDSIDLFQAYIDKTSDLQTAVLVTAFANPRYTSTTSGDTATMAAADRWHVWKDTYFETLQSWRAFAERTRFTLQHSRMSVDAEGQKLIRPPPHQLTLRCTHCQKSIAKPEDAPRQVNGVGGAATNHHKAGTQLPPARANPQQNPSAAAGTVCRKCGRHLPRCSLCMLWLGTPDAPPFPLSSSSAAAAATAGGGTGSGGVGVGSAVVTATGVGGGGVAVGGLSASMMPKAEEYMARFVNFCVHCGHGYHAHHGREWFAKHQICPVPSCKCMCARRRG